MRKQNPSLEKSFVKDIIAEAYFKKAWHGPNLHSALIGVTAGAAIKRPSKERHNIYEITVHSAYWVYRVINRIRKNPGLKFPMKGTNWFETPETLTNTEWKKIKKFLNELHEELYKLIPELRKKEFTSKSEKEKQLISRLLIGISMHDVYHAGQIQLIKKLIKR